MNELTRKLTEFDDEQLAGLYKNTFTSESGKLVLEDLKNRCFVKVTTAQDVANGLIYYNEGMRAVVLHIETQLDFEPVEVDRGES